MGDFAKKLNVRRAHNNVKIWDHSSSHIRYVNLLRASTTLTNPRSCLAHIINLATQAVLGAFSKTPHFDPSSATPVEPTVTMLDTDELLRDFVGVIRCIGVKVTYWI